MNFLDTCYRTLNFISESELLAIANEDGIDGAEKEGSVNKKSTAAISTTEGAQACGTTLPPEPTLPGKKGGKKNRKKDKDWYIYL